MRLILNGEICNGDFEVMRVDSCLMFVQVIWRVMISNLVSTYGPQVGLDESTKREFFEEFDPLLITVHRQDKKHWLEQDSYLVSCAILLVVLGWSSCHMGCFCPFCITIHFPIGVTWWALMTFSADGP